MSRGVLEEKHIWFLGGVWVGCAFGLWLGIVGFGMVF